MTRPTNHGGGRRAIDMTGETYGRLTVIERAPNASHSAAWWLCRCQCGNTKSVPRRSLVVGNTQSCGCLRAEALDAYYRGRRAARQFGQNPTKRSSNDERIHDSR